MRTSGTQIVKATLGLFVCGLAIATVFAMAAAVRSAYAGPERATVPLAFHRMTIQGQVARHRRDYRANQALRRKLRLAQRQLKATRQTPHGSHPDERKALCVHGGEGAWSSNTGNGYYGGMQMNRQFAGTYGAWAMQAYGLPHLWPTSVQIAVSLQAVYSGRGWGPWPTTARACGLL